MKRGAGGVLAALILISLMTGGARTPVYLQSSGEIATSKGRTQSNNKGIISGTSSQQPTPNKNAAWNVPPDPRCFLIAAIREFYGSRNPADLSTASETLPAGPFYEAYSLDRLGCPPEVIGNSSTPSDKWQSKPRSWGIPTKLKVPIEFMIATAPDPVRSHLSLFFDRSIDAIQQGAQAAGYVFSVAAMPWNPEQREAPADFNDKLAWEYYQRAKEKLPGLMIFRKIDLRQNSKAEEDLFVFVVGETPTGGLHKKQFRNALLIASDIQNVLKTNNIAAYDLSIMGPTFSGSLPSLNDLLINNKDQICALTGKDCSLEVHSGTVTSYAWVNWFTRETSQARISNPPGVNINFITLQESDDYAECYFLTYALNQKYELSEIAEISEDETAFGGGGSLDRARDKCKLPGNGTDIVRLYFPREISQLRSAYQNELQHLPQTEAGKQPARTTLPLNLEDTGSDEDSVPSYAHQQYPLSQESIMMTIAAALRTHHSRFVLIKASDPVDLLFVTRFLRQAYPQGRIVTLGSDLLYRREVEDDLLHGIMAITPYSLLPRADDSVARPDCLGSQAHVDPVFPSSYSSGTYNAVLSLLPMEGCSEVCDKACANLAMGCCGGSAALRARPYTEFGWPNIAGPKPNDRCYCLGSA